MYIYSVRPFSVSFVSTPKRKVVYLKESKIEKYLKDEVEKVGGQAFKFTSPGTAGVPDRIVLHKGKSYFVELKAPGKKLRALQEYQKRQFKMLGFKVYVIDNLEKVEVFINEIQSTRLPRDS